MSDSLIRSSVIEPLRRAPEVIVPLVREIPEAIVKRRPGAGKWSAHEHACHLAHVHKLFMDHLELMLREPAPVIEPYLPGAQDPDDMLLGMDLAAALDQYTSDRRALVTRLDELSPAEWERSARHPEYRVYSVFIMFRHLALHDFLHAYRIEELLLRPDWAFGKHLAQRRISTFSID